MASDLLPRFEDTDFWLDIKDVTIGPEIGKGQFSTVHVGKYFGDLVAVKKQIRKETMLEAYILRELSVLKVAKHDNIVQYIGAYNQVEQDEDGYSASYIVTELCHGGDLLRVVLDHDTPLAWKTRLRIAKQAADAIFFLHHRCLIHRDIKSSNVLLDEHWNCKITDFGMARVVDAAALNGDDDGPISPRRNSFKRMTICGTEEYMAPEMMFDEAYDLSVDIFSFGMVLFEMLKRSHVGENDYIVRRPQTKFEIDMDAVRAVMPADKPESLFTLAEQCCAYDATMRPDAEEVKDWLQDLYECYTLDDDDECLQLAVEKTPSPAAPPIEAASATLLSTVAAAGNPSSADTASGAASGAASSAASGAVSGAADTADSGGIAAAASAAADAADASDVACTDVALPSTSPGAESTYSTGNSTGNSKGDNKGDNKGNRLTSSTSGNTDTSAGSAIEASDSVSVMPSFASTRSISRVSSAGNTCTSINANTSANTTPEPLKSTGRPKLPAGRRSVLVSRAVMELDGSTPPVSGKEGSAGGAGAGAGGGVNGMASNSGAAGGRGSVTTAAVSGGGSARVSLSTPRHSFLSNLLQEPTKNNQMGRTGSAGGLFGTSPSSGSGSGSRTDAKARLLVAATSANEKEVEEKLYERYGLIEDYNNDSAGLLDSHEITALAERKAVVLKEGFLNRRNESGFRTWKKLRCTLTETKLSWKSTSEHKRSHFDLKDTSIKYTPNRYHRFSLIQPIRVYVDAKDGKDLNNNNNNNNNNANDTAGHNSSSNIHTANSAVTTNSTGTGSSSSSSSSGNNSTSGSSGGGSSTANNHNSSSGVGGAFGLGGFFHTGLGRTPVAQSTKHSNASASTQQETQQQQQQQQQQLSQQAGSSSDSNDAKRVRSRGFGRDNSGRSSVTRMSILGSSADPIGNSVDGNSNSAAADSSSVVQVYQREFAAENAAALDEWLTAIQDAINEEKEEDWTEFTHTATPKHHSHHRNSAAAALAAEDKSDDGGAVIAPGPVEISAIARTLESPGSMKRMVSFIEHKSIFEFESISDWLCTIGLPAEYVQQYAAKFVEKGYADPALIGKTGLQEADFQHLEITNPSHCRLMQNSVSSYYTSTVRLAINGWTRFDNFLVFKVISRWQCNRSSIYLKISHFKKLDKMIRRELEGSQYADLLGLIPTLPFKVLGKYERGRLSVEFYSGLRRKLETYLLCVAEVLTDTPKLFLLLRFLELVAAVHVPRG